MIHKTRKREQVKGLGSGEWGLCIKRSIMEQAQTMCVLSSNHTPLKREKTTEWRQAGCIQLWWDTPTLPVTEETEAGLGNL